MRYFLIVVLAIFYFISVYFAIYALDPASAAPVAWFAVLLAMLGWLFIDAVYGDEPNLPLALLYLLPIICVTAGIIWWGLRVAGLWEPLR